MRSFFQHRKRKFNTGVAQQIAGIRTLELHNADCNPTLGSLRLGHDSQIIFSIKDYIGKSAALAQVILHVEDPEFPITPKIYLDYGLGFSEKIAFQMFRNEAGHWVALIANPAVLKAARLDITEAPADISIHALVVQPAALTEFLPALLGKPGSAREAALRLRLSAALDHLDGYHERIRIGDEGVNHVALAEAIAVGFDCKLPPLIDEDYLAWLKRYETLTREDLAWMQTRERAFKSAPSFSILMPVYNPPLDLLDAAILCLQNQTYSRWELCIADDASPDAGVRELIKARSQDDPRIKYVFRAENGHISAATNSAASLAQGDYLVLMDNDDIIPPHALFTVAHYIDANPDCRLLYSDEDKIAPSGHRFEPYYKGAFDRFLLYGHNMFSHLGIYRRDLFEEVGGFRLRYEGSQDYDLTLRCIERCDGSEIVHIPHVLYNWRQIPGSTSMGAGQKNYAFEAAKRALNDHFVRMDYPLEAIDSDVPGVSALRVLSMPEPVRISIVILTRDGFDILKPCIDSILARPDPLIEIVIVDNGSQDQKTKSYLKSLERDPHRFRIVEAAMPFNFSRLCNIGVAASSGHIVCLLNNDTEFLSGDIFERARALLAMTDVGLVGGRLLYPDGSVQHFGVYTGVGRHGIAEHAHHGLGDGVHAQFSKSRLIQQFNCVTGACMFVRRTDYDALGGFDEDLAVAYNDVDFCLRVRGAGLKIVCDPGIRLIHKESRSRGSEDTDEKKARLKRDADFMQTRWGESGLSDPFYNPNFSAQSGQFQLAARARQHLPWKAPEAL